MPISRNRTKKKKPSTGHPSHQTPRKTPDISFRSIIDHQKLNYDQPSSSAGQTYISRTVSRAQIQYTLITQGESHHMDSFFHTALTLLREVPKDVFQLRDPTEHYKRMNDVVIRRGPNVFSLTNSFFAGNTKIVVENFLEYSRVFNEDLVKVFIINNEIQNHHEVAKFLKQIPFSYFVIAGYMDEKIMQLYDQSNSFVNGHELIGLVERDLDKINNEFENSHGISLEGFEYKNYHDLNDKNPFHGMDVTYNNYYTLNQIWGNFWKKRPVYIPQEKRKIQRDKRMDFQIEQIRQLDSFRLFIHPEKPVTPIEPIFSPLIVIAPYHFPNYFKIKRDENPSAEEELLLRFSQIEQVKDYTYQVDENSFELIQKNPMIKMATAKTAQRLVILDGLAYLHAQLNHSPVFRFPVIGKSINKELSLLNEPFENKREVMDKILEIGKKLSQHSMSDSFRELLEKRNGQLVIISDLPMEWTRLGKYPLAMTHDICKLPEFNHNSVFNNYVHNQRASFVIGNDIIEHTLVIHSASKGDTSMRKMFRAIDSLKAEIPFKSVTCGTVAEISKAIKKFRPHFLIFDCHGGFDEESLSSFLVLDAEKKIHLTGDDIIKQEISAPLVFLSACSTMPNYGYVRFLSDAFMQAGAFSVTATYLPIKTYDATVLITRLIGNLYQHKSKVYHFNWLAFISHTLRGVFVYESIRSQQIQKKLPMDIDRKKIATFTADLMLFSQRESTFDTLLDFLKELNPEIELSFEDLDHEWLSYTTIGRADLIYFENWKEKHQKNSLSEQTYDEIFNMGGLSFENTENPSN